MFVVMSVVLQEYMWYCYIPNSHFVGHGTHYGT